LRKKKLFWRVNENIQAPEVRVIGIDGKQIGVIARDEAIAKAKKLNLDLVEVASKAKPPVARIINLGKLRYQEQKKLRSEQKKSKTGELKEVRFSPFIAENDYDTRLSRIKEFLEEKNKIRIVVKFKGRQMRSKQFGYNLLQRILEELGDRVSIDMKPKFLGRHLVMIISPRGKTKKKVETDAKAKN